MPERPLVHQSGACAGLGGLTPAAYAKTLMKETSTVTAGLESQLLLMPGGVAATQSAGDIGSEKGGSAPYCDRGTWFEIRTAD